MIQAQHYTNEAEMRAAYIARINRLRNPKLKPANVNQPEPEEPIVAKVYHTPGVPEWKKWAIHFDDHMRAFAAFNNAAGKGVVRKFIATRATQLGINYAHVMSRSRKQHIVIVRHQIMWEIKNVIAPSMSYPQIGKLFGNDHTVAMHAVRRIQNLKDRGEIETIEGPTE